MVETTHKDDVRKRGEREHAEKREIIESAGGALFCSVYRWRRRRLNFFDDDDDDVQDVRDEYKSSFCWEQHKKRFWTKEKSDNAAQKLPLVSSFRKISDNEIGLFLRVIEVFFRRW